MTKLTRNYSRNEEVRISRSTMHPALLFAVIFMATFVTPCAGFTTRHRASTAFRKEGGVTTHLQAVDIITAASQTMATAHITNPLSNTAFTSAINSFFETQPYLASFLTCSVKASAADMIAQQQGESAEGEIETKNEVDTTSEVDVSRNLGFLLYGGLYTGCFQNFLYNGLFPIWFGTDSSWITITKQVLADNFIFGPLLCLPIAYVFKGCFASDQELSIDSLRSGLDKYREDVFERNLLKTYWMIWMPVQFLTFSVIPPHFRVVFVALVSFFWFFLLSTISSKGGEASLESKHY